MGKHKDLNNFDKGKVVMDNTGVRAKPQLQLFWDVPSVQLSGATKSDPRMGKLLYQQLGHGQPKLTDAIGEQRETCVAQFNQRTRLIDAGLQRRLSLIV